MLVRSHINDKTWTIEADAPAFPPLKAFFDAFDITCSKVGGGDEVAVAVEPVTRDGKVSLLAT